MKDRDAVSNMQTVRMIKRTRKKWSRRKQMSIYLIDYENVNEAGLEGIASLSDEDTVYIFYNSQITKTIPFVRGIEMVKTNAQIEFIQTNKSGKNYLDFQLSTYLGYLVGSGKKGVVFIISKDAGFDSIVDFWKGRSINICRQESISRNKQKAPVKAEPAKKTESVVADGNKQGLPESYRKKVRAAVKPEKLPTSSYAGIYKAIVGSKSKTELNNALVKNFDNARGGKIYGLVKGIYDEYQKINSH
jgi:hypothetical protein